MRPLALAPLLLLCGCAVGSRTPSSNATLKVATASWVYFPRASQPSPMMESALTRLGEQNGFAALESWTRLPKLPAWASVESLRAGECEMAVPSGVPVVMDAFDYMVIVGRNRRMIVIRSGGFGGVRQIFEEKQSNQAPERTTAAVTPRADAASEL